MTSVPTQVREFLANSAPLDKLDEEQLNALAGKAVALYLTEQNCAQLLSEHSHTLFLVHSGQYIVESAAGMFNHISEGDYFAYGQLMGDDTEIKLQVASPGIVYGFSQALFTPYLQKISAIKTFFKHQQNNSLLDMPGHDAYSLWLYKPLSDVLTHQLVRVEANCTIQLAAQTMQQNGVSSLLITQDEQLVGILTDRDLRNRVVAQQVDTSLPVSDVMTSAPAAISKDATLFDAMCLMTEHNIHHLPVIDSVTGQPITVVTNTDVVRQQRGNILFLLNELSKVNSLYELTRLSWQIPHYFTSTAKRIGDFDIAGKILSQATDIMTRKLLDFFHQTHGCAPMDYCWLVYGSQAREDQNIGSDQDNALLLANEPDEQQADYFAQMGDYVCQGLGKCGIKLCSGNMMASNPKLRQSMQHALKESQSWVREPSKEALLHFNIYLDVRAAAGNKTLLVKLQAQRRELLKQSIFLAALARQCNVASVPLTLFNKFAYEKDLTQKDCIDLKHKAVAIINDIVRIYALASGLTVASTLQRLKDMPPQSSLAPKDGQNLRDIWLFLNRLRWRHQIANHVTDNNVSVSELSSIEKHQLKASLQSIAAAQQALLVKFSAGMGN
jgi:CBS domain-containing protein